MLHVLLRILIFVLVVAAGACIAPLGIILAVKFGVMPQLPDQSPLAHQLSLALMVFPWLVLTLATMVALGWFFARGREARAWCLLAPLYGTGVYVLLVFIYFNFVPVT